MRIALPLLLAFAALSTGCTKGKYVPIFNQPIDVAIPMQQETIANAIYDALSKADPAVLAPLKGKKAFVEVATGFNNLENYITGAVEWKLAKEHITVIGTEKKDIGSGYLYQYPTEADYRVLAIVDVVGGNLLSQFKEFLFFSWGLETKYQGACEIALVLQPLAGGAAQTIKLSGSSKEVIIKNGYVYE